ncbi:MAG: hypothetical protein ACKO8Z_01110 [Prosthecobacter sp.]
MLLNACHSSDEGSLPVIMFESDAGEAVIRHVIATLPDLNPGIAKNYSIVLGEISRDGMMTPASESFVKRFANLNLEFVNAINLKAHEPDQIIVDNKNFLATFVLQLRKLRQLSAKTWEAETGWSYKKEFGHAKIFLEQMEGRINVIKDEKIP